MAFDPNVDNSITLNEAIQLTKSYRSKYPNETLGNAYGRPQMQDLLNQVGCEGFRIYNGLNLDGNIEFVIVAVDVNGNDLYEGILLDQSQPCPNACSLPNPLNSRT